MLRRRVEQLQLVILEEIHYHLHDIQRKIYKVSQKLAALRDSLHVTNIPLEAVDELRARLSGTET